MVAEAGLEPASTDYESVPGGFTTPVYSASKSQTGYGGRIRTYVNEFQKLAPFQLGHSVRFVDWWTWHDLNVRPRPSQSRALIPLSYRSVIRSGGERAALTATSAVTRSHHRNLAEAAGVEPAHAMRGDLANRCHTIRRRLHRLAEGTGIEPASDERGSFRDYCLTS